MSAEELSVHADLFARDGGFTPRPAWQVIEAARRQMLTGQLSLATTPTTHVFLRDGQVYFAERTTDGGLGVRLLVEGVITRQQMGKGALLVSGVEHLGRMFQRDTSIDRQPVELCVELMTDDVLTSVANDVIDHYTMTMYKRHPNGIDRWLPNRIELITYIVEGSHLAEPDAAITVGPGPRRRATHVAEPVAVVEEVVEVVADAKPVADVEPVIAEEVVVEEVVVEEVVVEEVVETIIAEVIVVEEVVEVEVVVEEVVEEVVVEEVVVEAIVVEEEEVVEVEVVDVYPNVVAEHAITEELAIIEADPVDAITAALALAATISEDLEPVAAPDAPSFSLSDSIGNSLAAAATTGLLDPAAPLTPDTLFAESLASFGAPSGSGISLAQSAVDAIMSSAIADEVAEAVRRALAAIDAATQPVPNISPADFVDPRPGTQHDTATSAA